MRFLTAIALAAALATSAVQAAESPAEPAKVTSASSTELGKLLKAADLEFETQESGRLKLLYKFTDGRSQLVFMQPMSDIREMGVVEIYSPVMKLEGPLASALGKRLLESSGSQKLGYFGIEDVEGKAWVFAYHNLPSLGLSSKSLSATLITVAELADEMEKEQLGTAKDEF